MIIQCEKCLTRFNLDEALLQEKGTRVKCTVCSNIFTAYPDKKDLDREIWEAREGDDEEKFWDDQEGPGKDLEEETEGPLEEAVYEPETTRIGKRNSRLPLFFLLIILLFTGGAALIHFLMPDMLPRLLPFLKTEQVKETTDTGVSRLAFHSVSGEFVDSKKEGSIFLIKGKVKNDYPENRSYLLMQGSILDNKGKTVKTQTAYAGNILTDEEIKAMSLTEIEGELKSRARMETGKYLVAAGASIPFMIVLGGLPDDVSEFTVKAIRSSPGV